MAKYGWMIDKDHAADKSAPEGTNANAVGMMGPSDITEANEARLKAGEGVPFQMCDDDGVVYEGRYVRGQNTLIDFHPLDEFGTPNYGCTDIKYLENGVWTVL